MSKELSVSDRSAEGAISVPMGEDRTFWVQAFDGNGLTQYWGSANIDIMEKAFTVKIGLEPIPPNSLVLIYINPIDPTHVPPSLFEWTKSFALDFAAYELYRAPDSGVTLASDLIYTTGGIDSTFYFENAQLGGDYYYRVFVVDTEGLRSDGSNEIRVDFM